MPLGRFLRWFQRRRRAAPRPSRSRIGSIGPGVAGAFYEFLNEDKRKAIEIVVEQKAAYTAPETADGTTKTRFEIKG